jgi:TPR repeat protein
MAKGSRQALSKKPSRDLFRVSRWLWLRHQDESIRKAVDHLAFFVTIAIVSGVALLIAIVFFTSWSLSNWDGLIAPAFSLCAFGLLSLFQWHQWRDSFSDLLSGKVAITDLPESLRVSADLKAAAKNGDIKAQSQLGESYRMAGDAEQRTLPRVVLFHAAEIWLQKAAEGGDLFAQKSLAAHLHRCGQHKEAALWDDISAEASAKPVREAAEKGDSGAQWALAVMLRDGKGVLRDLDEALKWFRRAAESDTLTAAWQFGIMLRDGDRIPRNPIEAGDWLRKSAGWKHTYDGHATLDAGSYRKFELGMMLRDGKLVPKSEKEADEWFYQAAEKFRKATDDITLYKLGVMYRDGLGVPQSESQAAMWFRKSAENAWWIEGFRAQVELGVMLRDGVGVPRSRREAASWFLRTLTSQRAGGWGVRRRAASELLRTIPLIGFVFDALQRSWAGRSGSLREIGDRASADQPTSYLKNATRLAGNSLNNYDVFICYSTEDKATADGACAALEAERIRCWIASRDVAPGADWPAAIVQAIDQSRALVLIFSSKSNKSKQVHREVQRAFEKGLSVVPLRVENVHPESSLAYYMGSVHWLDALTPPMEAHFRKLARTVSALLQSNEVEQKSVLS